MRLENREERIQDNSPLGLAGRISGIGAAAALIDLGRISQRSTISAGRQVRVIFDPTSGVLTAKDLLTGETVQTTAISGSVFKGHLPFGHYQVWSDRREGWWRLELEDKVVGDDKAAPSNGPEFTVLRMHPGEISAGCITAVRDDPQYERLSHILSRAESYATRDISTILQPKLLRSIGVTFEAPDWLHQARDELQVHGELDVKELNYCPTDSGASFEQPADWGNLPVGLP